MPSPLAHALGGFAAGWLVAGPPVAEDDSAAAVTTAHQPKWRSSSVRRAAVFAALGVAADLDLLVGRHSQFTHSLGAALIVSAAAAFLLRGRRRWLTLAFAAGAAYGVHVLLDWLGQDATPPFGITALWPFSRTYYLSHLDVFSGISREPWRPGALWHDILSIVREAAIMVPVAAAAWWVRRRPASGVQVPRAGSRPAGQEVPARARAASGGRKCEGE